MGEIQINFALHSDLNYSIHPIAGSHSLSLCYFRGGRKNLKQDVKRQSRVKSNFSYYLGLF